MNIADVVVRGKPFINNLINGSIKNNALIITGGNLQGSRTAGMVCALEALGLAKSFDAAYGASCGAANIAYFLSGQALLGTSIYYQDVLDYRYTSLTRWPFVDMNYLVYEILARIKPLAVDKIKKSPTKFMIPITNKNGDAVFLTVEKDIPTLNALRLTMSIFIYAGSAISWDGEKYCDGWLSEPFPFRKALDEGHKNILVLLNMPFNWDDKDDNVLLRTLKWPIIRNESKNFRRAYFSRQKRYKEQLQDLCAGIIPKDANITIIAPSANCAKLPFYTRNASLIKKCAEEGVSIIGEVFNKKLSVELL